MVSLSSVTMSSAAETNTHQTAQNRRSTKKLDAATIEKLDYKVSIFLLRENE